MSDDVLVQSQMDALLSKNRKPGIMLHRPYPPIDVSPIRSRIGGLPELPAGLAWPLGRKYGQETPMHFLAQIDCAELPPTNSQLPERGLLFFFAVNAEEQIWDTDNPRDSVCVLYAPDVPQGTPMREAADGLQPILSAVASDDAPYWPRWALPGEAGPSVHASWPLVARRLDTWPEYDVLPDGVQKPEYAAYQRRLNALRAGSAVAATGLPTRSTMRPNWEVPFGAPWKFPASRPGQEAEFPQAAIMIDRIARLVGRERMMSSGEPMPGSDVLDWVRRAGAIGLHKAPSEEDRSAFRDWMLTLIDDVAATGMPTYGLARIVTGGILSSIAYAGGCGEVAALIPPYFYNALENHHLPFEQTKPGELVACGDWQLEARIHQMLGHPVLLQGDSSDGMVCLLQLADDDAIELPFGDCGNATFWIEEEDLLNRRFDRVVGVVASH